MKDHITYEQIVEIHNEKKVHIHQNLFEFCGWLNQLYELQPKNYLEIGSFKMGSAQLVLETIPSIEMMVCLDINDLTKQSVLKEKIDSYRDRIEFVCGDSSDPRVRIEMEERLQGKKFDAAFIDGDHSYEGVIADYVLYKPLVRKGGKIAFHDTKMENMPPNEFSLGYLGSQSFWAGLEKNYPNKCESIIADPGPWGNYGIGVYTI